MMHASATTSGTRKEPAGFLERPRMRSASVWEHERTLSAFGAFETLLADRVAFTPRVSLVSGPHRRVITATPATTTGA
jgi:hypothetical protein